MNLGEFLLETLARTLGTALGIFLCFLTWWFLLGGKRGWTRR